MTSGSAPPTASGRLIDLHLHSTASDGSKTPLEVVREACAAGLAAIALTDHDTVSGVPDATAAADGTTLRVIAGVELSAYEGQLELHILGLHLADVARMDGELAVFREARRSRAERIVARLNAIGVRITFDDVLALAGGASIGRPHIAKALVEHGWARDHRDAFDRYLGLGRPAYLEKKQLSFRDAIDLVHTCGGLAVLAHPGVAGTMARIGQLADLQLDGLEVLHPSHSGDERARLQAIADHFGLVPSGGSDSHGAAEGPRVIGSMKVPESWLGLHEARLAVRSAERVARAAAPGA